jgi:C1A family cysteine protease
MDNTIVTSKIGRQYLQHMSRVEPSKLVLHTTAAVKTVPTSVDLRPMCGPIRDQGALGACTAFALSAIVSYIKQKTSPSELFIYYNERVIEKTVSQDAGATLTNGITSLKKYGVCDNSLWPYNVNKFAVKPNANCYVQAAKNKALAVLNIKNTMTDMKKNLTNGCPFVVGIPIYESFESDAVAFTGMVPMPLPDEQLLGYHAVVCVGFNNTLGCWLMRNSWGTSWGKKGYFYLPYPYLTTDASDAAEGFDLWVITKMSATQKIINQEQIDQINKINQINQINQINKINKINQINKIHKMNQINQLNKIHSLKTMIHRSDYNIPHHGFKKPMI